MRGMDIRHAFRSVFGEAKRPFRIQEMKKRNPQIIQKHSRHIPAKIEIPADRIRDMRDRVPWGTHGVAGKHSRPCFVHLMTDFLQEPVVLQHAFPVFCGDRDFI